MCSTLKLSVKKIGKTTEISSKYTTINWVWINNNQEGHIMHVVSLKL